MLLKVSAVLCIGLSLTSCGVQNLRPVSSDQLTAPNILAFSKKRYTSLQASGGLANWNQRTDQSREIATFEIVTNQIADAVGRLNSDMQSYCTAHGGTYDDFSDAINTRSRELTKQNTSVVESTTLNGTAVFECGPEGRGTVSSDWTLFNPNQCRQLYRKHIDLESINSSMGNTPNFGCTVPGGALFIGKVSKLRSIPDMVAGTYSTTLLVRINQGVSGTAIPYRNYPEIK